ncbi:uncharacterized protein LOC144704285 [Wolffia australiana]
MLVEIESAEGLQKAETSGGVEREEEEKVLCMASFEGMEDSFLRYQTALWILYSFVLILAWGIGILMLLYAPIRRYVLRREFRSRKLYLTPDAIIYKVTKPAAFPFLGSLKKETFVVLASVSDIAIEQGYLQSFFGVYSLRIKNLGVQRPSNDHVQILGLANPRGFRTEVLTYLSRIKSGNFGRLKNQDKDDLLGNFSFRMSTTPKSERMGRPPSGGDEIMLRLDEVGSSVKRVHSLIERSASEKTRPGF